MLTNRTSRWSLAAAVLCIILLAASWFLLISPRRADAAAVREQAAQSDVEAVTLKGQIAELKAQYADLPKQLAVLQAIKVQLPPKAGVPDLIRNLRTFSSDSGVALDSLAPGAPILLGGAAAPSTVAAAGSVVNIPLQVGVTGDYFEAALFVKDLQTKLRRSMLITAVSVAPAQEKASAVQSTATPTAAPTTGATGTPTSDTTPTVAPVTLDRVTLSITSSVFVLMDGTTTLEDVERQLRAGGGQTVSAAPVSTSTPAPTSTS